mgnify:CR=1 FL=1
MLLLTFLAACTTVPITNRKQLKLYPESDMIALSLTQYNQFLNESEVISTSNPDAALIQKVGNKLSKACEDFLKKTGQSNRIENYQWEFNLVESDQLNAWCMPGGKVVFYTGIMPVCQDEAGVAVVMSHEIAHAVAAHGNERMSQQMAIQLGTIPLAVATSQNPGMVQDIFLMSYGLGSQIGLLAYSRTHESEADKMGLVFMEYAGFDSNEAIEFWKRMAAQGGSGVPEFMSTHPANETRIRNIKEFIPTAKSLAL